MMLPIIWFVLWGVLWAVYFMLDGFDLGLGTLMPFLAKDDTDRRVIYRAMGPFWDGNEVWLITAGGVTFAAFPTTYAVMFSGLYSALMLILFALILRGVSMVFRGEVDDPRWRRLWDAGLFLGSFLPALLFGVAFANLFKGIPIDAEGIFQGNLLTLLNPYGLAGGILFVLLFLVHGSLWLAVKTHGELHHRAAHLAATTWPVLLGMAVIFLAATRWWTTLFDNYAARPVLLIIPVVAVAALIAMRAFIQRAQWWRAWFASSAHHRGHHPVRRGGPLSRPAQIQPQPGLQPDRLQLVLQPPDLEDHAGRGLDLCAPGHCLPGLGPFPLQGQGGTRRRGPGGGLLT